MTTKRVPTAADGQRFEVRIFRPVFPWHYGKKYRQYVDRPVTVCSWYPVIMRTGDKHPKDNSPIYSIEWKGWVMEFGAVADEADLAKPTTGFNLIRISNHG